MQFLKQFIRFPILGIIYAYRFFISPFIPHSCRFQPTCSAYALEAFKTKKLHEAIFLSIKRLLKCHPWGGSGFDPVPSRNLAKKPQKKL